MSHLRNRFLLPLDAALVAASALFFYALRFEGLTWSADHRAAAAVYAAVCLPTSLAIFVGFGLYRRLWRYASVAEVQVIFVAGLTSFAVCLVLGAWVLPLLDIIPVRIPLTVLVGSGVLNIGLIAAPRLLMRVGGWRRIRSNLHGAERRVLIVGAGTAGQSILKEIWSNPALQMRPVGFVDDDRAKQGYKINGLPIYGRLKDLPDLLSQLHIGQVVVALPGAPGSTVRQVVRAALDAGVQTQTVPGLSEILSGKVRVSQLRNVEIQDLLRREPITTDLAKVSALLTDHVVLVTGAGGSIGSELCRQIGTLGPSKLVLLGHGENPIFEILHELRPMFPDLNIVPVIADTRDRQRIFSIFEQHRPFTVFHAAAHKHVPLMEENVIESVTNNVIGTRNMVDAAVATGTSHLVLISTDKAVRPTNVMGATKRVAEHVVRDAALTTGKNFVSVRFGNVLGSRGSVVPTFVRQIQEGGPVTVTHPEMQRYFMTIPEAVQLVLQAGAIGRGGELFMLDMGEPVKIVDLARDLIRLSGLEEGVDIQIQFTGVRAGEKLYEEMFLSDEKAVPTEHPKVLRATNDTVDAAAMMAIDELIQAAAQGTDEVTLRHLLSKVVPDFVADGGPNLAPTPAFGVKLMAGDNRPMRRKSGEMHAVRRPSGPMRSL